MLWTIIVSVDNVAFGDRHSYFAKLFNDFRTIPKLVLDLKGVDLNRPSQLDVFNSFLKREAG